VSTRVDPLFIENLQSYGAFDITACFNCGNCSAVCPLSSNNDSFPRKMIRYSQIGAKDRLLSCKELWLCYYCGECSDTCPRQAEPGEFMASARRYAIATLDPTGLSRLLYRSKSFTAAFITILSAFFTLVFLTMNDSMPLDSLDLFRFIPFEVIHDVGLAVIALALLSGIIGIIRMRTRLSAVLSPNRATGENGKNQKDVIKRFIFALKQVFSEIITEKRYRDCQENESQVPWYRNRWFIHWSIMWGFLGLAAATGLDYIWMIFGDKIPGQPDPLWWPNRILGNISGLLLVYGCALALFSRVLKDENYSSHSLLSDWLFLWLLFITGLTGFIVEITIYIPEATIWGYLVFLIHVVLGMEIVFLLPFTKFAHAMYRPLALLIYNFTRPEHS
jgi:ferredoxin